jgi:hypothetical protein
VACPRATGTHYWPDKHAPEGGLIGGLRGQIGSDEENPFQLQVCRPVAAYQFWCPTHNFSPTSSFSLISLPTDSFRVPSGAISYSSRVGFVPNERKWKGRGHRYNMGTIKNSFVAVWYRGRSSQGSGPRGPLTETSPNRSHASTNSQGNL